MAGMKHGKMKPMNPKMHEQMEKRMEQGEKPKVKPKGGKHASKK